MQNKRISKFLSFVLRHQPEAIGLNMDGNGWVDLDELIEKMQAQGKEVNHAIIEEIVATNPKQRFKIDQVQNRIRANQGHSLDISLELEEKIPPPKLFHGTAIINIEGIKKNGLKKMNRQHVHLSMDYETAKNVGGRHGKPIILEIDCKRMVEDGIRFFLSENKVWLTESVEVKYIIFEQ